MVGLGKSKKPIINPYNKSPIKEVFREEMDTDS
jgi:hypothetical protein